MRPDWRTLLAAVLVTLSFTPFELPLVWIAFVPWLLALDRAPHARGAVAQALWLSFFYIVGLEFWVALALHDYGGLPWWAAGGELLFYSLIAELQFVAFALFYKKSTLSGKALPFSSALILALAYTGLDWLFPKLYVESLGHIIYHATWLRQAADLGGVALLTFLIFLANLAAFELWRWWRRRPAPFPRALPLAVLALLAAALGYGAWRSARIREATDHPVRRVQVALIQGNIDNELRMGAEYQEKVALEKILKQYLAISERALAATPRPDFLVWPESAYPSRFGHPETDEGRRTDSALRAWVSQANVPLVFGAPDFDGARQFNGLFVLTPDGRVQVHRKSKLVPFGEYIPGADHFKGLQEVLPIANLGAGAGPEILEVPTSQGTVRIAPIICYEVLFSSFVTPLVSRGAELLVNVTNESWFGATNEPYIHLALSTFRSLESRLAQLRATNTGISTLILPDGEATRRTALNREEIVAVSVPLLAPQRPLVASTGEWFGPAALLAAAACAAGGVLRRRPRGLLK